MPLEIAFTLATPDGATIYGRKNAADKKANAALFMVHGLTGHMYEYPFKRAADYFSAEGFDVYRFNLYDGEEGCRQLVDCTLQTHADDFSTVLAAFAENYQKTFAVGHSYGGPTVMLANPSVTALSLWDPSFDLTTMHEDFADNYKKLTGCYAINWGTTSLIGEGMYNHAKSLNLEVCTQLAKDSKAPVQVVFAGDGYYIKRPVNYHSFGHPQNRHDVIPGTTHCFYEGESCEQLLQATHTWFKQWL